MILLIVSLLIYGIAILTLPGIIILYSYTKSKKRKIKQQKIIDILQIKTNIYFPIKYASQNRFEKFWKYFPWEETGILHFKNNKELIFTYLDIFENIHDIIFNINESQIEWEGIVILNGFTSWFSISKNNELHYFTSDTGTFISESRLTTKNIYAKIKK